MNAQRMKFAWARGARIQVPLYRENSNEKIGWSVDYHPFSPRLHWESRIRPEDEHLQYGPVSTALRDMALYTDSVDLDELTEMFMDLAGSGWFLGAPLMSGVSHRKYQLLSDFARLFFAECLADEGL